MQRRGVREHEPLGERAGLRLAVAQSRDAVVEQPAARLQQARERAGVGVDVHAPDVLHHADAGDRVERLAAQLAVVGHADLDAVGDALGRRALARPAACGSDSVMPVTWTPCSRAAWIGERAPAAADVEHPLAGLQRQLLHTSSSLVRCASSSVSAPRDQTAHEYVIEASRNSAKYSFETS